MTIESATYIGQLNTSYPEADSQKRGGDDHLRLLKSTVKNCFKGMNRPFFAVSNLSGEQDRVLTLEDNFTFFVSINTTYRLFWLPTVASVGDGFCVKICVGAGYPQVGVRAPDGAGGGSFEVLAGRIYTMYSGLGYWIMECSALNSQVALKSSVDALQGQLSAPAGTRMTFNQPATTPGWFDDTNPAYFDTLLRISNGEAPGIGGAWGITGLTGGAASLVEAHLPPISPRLKVIQSTIGLDPGVFPVTFARVDGGIGGTPGYIDGFGSGAPHAHAVLHDGNWRPRYTNFRLCQHV